jgi:hypothetical protein
MADEITLSLSFRFSKSGRYVDTADFGALGLEFDVSGTDYVHKTQNIGTTAEALSIGDIGTCGWMVVKNLDASNYVEISRATFTSGQGTVKLKAGEVAAFRLGSNTPYALANTAACDIEYILVED